VVKLKLAALEPVGVGAAGARPQLVGLFLFFRTPFSPGWYSLVHPF
jgi:hypothetical protein